MPAGARGYPEAYKGVAARNSMPNAVRAMLSPATITITRPQPLMVVPPWSPAAVPQQDNEGHVYQGYRYHESDLPLAFLWIRRQWRLSI